MSNKENEIFKEDPFLLSIMASKMDSIVSQMTLSIYYTARSAILNTCHDFSTAILTGGTVDQIRVLSMYAGVPLHCVTSLNSIQPILKLYPGDIRKGDAFFNNSPYYGNTHHADYTIMVPVFYEDEIMFWTLLRCHQNDVGMPVPDTYNPYAKDVYEEGPHLPVVRLQRDYKNNEEWIRFFRNNIRYPDLWYGDYLAQMGGVRKGEELLEEYCQKYGKEVVKAFIEEWIDYTERRVIDKIRELPKGTWHAEIMCDPLSFAPDGIPLQFDITIDPDEAIISVDATKNIDALPGGINTTESTASGGIATGIIPSLAHDIPFNSGFFRRFRFKLREGSVYGIPVFPTATSTGTTYCAERAVNVMRVVFTDILLDRGASEGGYISPGASVVQGNDFRHGNTSYGHGMFMSMSGGPATKDTDGWPLWLSSVGMGAIIAESVEMSEQRIPHFYKANEILPDSAGPGQWRGGIGTYNILHPLHTRLSIASFGEAEIFPPAGVAGGFHSISNEHWVLDTKTGKPKKHFPLCSLNYCEEDEDWLVISQGGGGFGDPLDRDPERVSKDARNGFISIESAMDDYGVVLKIDTELYDVDYEATGKQRAKLRKKSRDVEWKKRREGDLFDRHPIIKNAY